MRGVKRERILRVLLNDPEGELTKYRIAKLADTSIAWTMEFLKSLEKKDLIEKTEVKNFEGVLDCWFSIGKRPVHHEFFVESPEKLLKSMNLVYALTTYKAENLLNHYLFPARTDIYIRREDLQEWKNRITKEGLVGKGNLRLLIYDDHVFYNKKRISDMWVASLPQVLIDLRREGGVCQEAYEMMVKRYVRTK